jgi:hypothetical protein
LLGVLETGSLRFKNGTDLTPTIFDPYVPIFKWEGFMTLEVLELLKYLELEVLRILDPPILLVSLDPPPINSDGSLEADMISEVLLTYA